MKTSKKAVYRLYILLSIIASSIGVGILYLFNMSLILKAFRDYDGALQVVLIISTRIIILAFTSYYLFHKWLKQEAQYLTDIPFLLGLFFIILMFGKAIDLFWDLTFFSFTDTIVLLFLKFRFFIIIFEVAPLLYLGLEIIFFRVQDRFNRLKDKKFMNKLRIIIISSIVFVESFTVIITSNNTIMGLILPCIVIPSLIGIVYIFFLAYRLKRLTVVKPGILTIGFFLYLVSNIFRPLMQNILGEEASYIIIAELVDIIVFLVILVGLYKKNTT